MFFRAFGKKRAQRKYAERRGVVEETALCAPCAGKLKKRGLYGVKAKSLTFGHHLYLIKK
jgi:hypothetical protein